MIDRKKLAKAASDADREVELNGLPGWAEKHDVELAGLAYVASQRALRAAMVLDGLDPTNRTLRVIHLSPAVEALIPTLAGVWMDGFAAGLMLD